MKRKGTTGGASGETLKGDQKGDHGDLHYEYDAGDDTAEFTRNPTDVRQLLDGGRFPGASCSSKGR